MNFYARDKENMQRFPPAHYNQAKNPGQDSSLSESKIESAPEELAVRHSVLKGLWFLIMNNLTNLIMEKRREIQQKTS